MIASAANQITATIALPEETRAPKELQVKFRLPPRKTLRTITVNDRQFEASGPHNDTVSIPAQNAKRFEVVARFS